MPPKFLSLLQLPTLRARVRALWALPTPWKACPFKELLELKKKKTRKRKVLSSIRIPSCVAATRTSVSYLPAAGA